MQVRGWSNARWLACLARDWSQRAECWSGIGGGLCEAVAVEGDPGKECLVYFAALADQSKLCQVGGLEDVAARGDQFDHVVEVVGTEPVDTVWVRVDRLRHRPPPSTGPAVSGRWLA